MRYAALVLVILLAGCGGSGGKDYSSPKALADALGCTGYNEESGAIAPADVATCQFDGEQVTLVVGDDASQRDATVEMAAKVARDFGVKHPGGVVLGGKWAVLTESRSAAEDAQAKVGGNVKS